MRVTTRHAHQQKNTSPEISHHIPLIIIGRKGRDQSKRLLNNRSLLYRAHHVPNSNTPPRNRVGEEGRAPEYKKTWRCTHNNELAAACQYYWKKSFPLLRNVCPVGVTGDGTISTVEYLTTPTTNAWTLIFAKIESISCNCLRLYQ